MEWIVFQHHHHLCFVVVVLRYRIRHLQGFELVVDVNDDVVEEVDSMQVMFDVMNDRVVL